MSNYLIARQLFLFTWLFALPAALISQPCGPVSGPNKLPLFDLFNQNELPEITLTADFDSIKANIRNKSYVLGSFEVQLNRKSCTKLNVRLRPRGKSRRMMCDFPPLKLKFFKENLDSNGLEQFNDFKLVSHCLTDNNFSEDNIKKEFLVYQLFNQLTPYSFKASLVKITYKNTGSSFRKSTNLGIIIEDSESLAHRNGCQVLSNKVINLDSLHRKHELIASVFQYMIGNADWSYVMGRNMELIKFTDNQIVPVPYDFDYAGLVKAPYARANTTLGQKTVLDRVYLGNAKSHEELTEIFRFFKLKKADLLKIVEDFDTLDSTVRQEMQAYILSFYEIIESKERVENEMLSWVKKK